MNRNGKLFFIHKWCGLVLAAFLTLQAFTGVVLSFRAELTKAMYPAEKVVANDRVVAAVVNWTEVQAKSREQGFSIERIHFFDTVALARLMPPGSDWPVMAMFDRSSGQLIKEGSLFSFPIELAARLHYSLVVGGVGGLIIGLEGFLLAAMVITGFILWWPAPGRWSRSLTLTFRQRGTGFWIQLHKVVGAWLAAILLLAGLSGFILVFEDYLKPVVAKITPVTELAMPQLPAFDGTLAKRNYGPPMAVVEREFSGERLRQLRFIGEDHRALIFILHNSQGENTHALNFAIVDRVDNTLAATFDADSVPAAERFFQSMLPLHSGHIAGLPGRLLNLAGGLGLLTIAISGFVLWLRRRKLAVSRVNPLVSEV
ncbi:MAG TPA: hypothetical protein DIW43_13955 [Spongiibacteraceae bacterium]|nr:hypothetical protein [Spongiibacteraceae bacterium]MBN51645.1 hypothetical protein [Spongiibacteraceae bacterium]HCS28560.1 hypothetical protein [Spongiibacteraceae bacterium]